MSLKKHRLSDSSDLSNSSNSSNSRDSGVVWSDFIIKNRYIILNKIGKGSYCSVWTVYDINMQELVALKIYNEEVTTDALNEIQVLDIMKTFNLPNVIMHNDTFNFNYGDDIYVMHTMDLCGYSLNHIIKLFKNDFITDVGIYKKYINFVYDSNIKLTELIEQLHKNGYCHTDIKPENILIDIPVLENNLYLNKIKKIHSKLLMNGSEHINQILHNECKKIVQSIEINDNDVKQYLRGFNFSIKLSDFGTALKAGDNTIYKKHTQYYKSPKILLKYELDYTYDYWALGCTLYELLMCEVLFDPYESELENKYGENDDRNLMYLIVSALGMPDKKILLKSKESDVFFNSTYNIPRAYVDIRHNDFINKLIIRSNSIAHSNVHSHEFTKLFEKIVEYVSYSFIFGEV